MSRLFRTTLLWLLASSAIAALQLEPLFSLQIPGTSMEPTLQSGQTVLIEPLSAALLETLDIGDIIVFEAPTQERQRLVKRIVGMPGDVIEIRDKLLLRDDVVVEEAYVQHLDPAVADDVEDPSYVLDQMARVEVPAGELFVLGDNRDRSYDSRSFGTVSIWSVLGSVR